MFTVCSYSYRVHFKVPINPKLLFCLNKYMYNSEQNAQKFLIWVKTGIFYEFSKWRKIEIQKPITEPQKLPKRNGSRVVRDVKPGLRSLGVSFACCDYDQRL